MTRPPVISEATAKRQVAAAKAQVTLNGRAVTRYKDFKGGASRELHDMFLERLARAWRNLDAAEARLEAVRSQARDPYWCRP